MARNFGNAVGNYLSTATAPLTNATPRPCSIGAWVNITTNEQNAIYNNDGDKSNPKLYLNIDASGANTVMQIYSGAYTTSSTFVMTTGAWAHYLWTWNTDDAVVFYRNGTSVSSGTRASGGVNGTGSNIGCLTAALHDMNGSIAELAIWNVLLDAAEANALGKGFSPFLIRPASLVSYVPILGNNSPENDRSTSGRTWTVNGTLTKSDHPGVMMPPRRRMRSFDYTAAGGAAARPILVGGRLVDQGLTIKGLVH